MASSLNGRTSLNGARKPALPALPTSPSGLGAAQNSSPPEADYCAVPWGAELEGGRTRP